MARAAVVGLFICLGWLSACAGKVEGAMDDTGAGVAGGSSTKPKPTPVQACQGYASTWCTKAFGCYVQVGRLNEASRQYNVDQCTKLIVDNLPCSAATSAGSGYEQCLSQIRSMACSNWNVPNEKFATIVPPSSCDQAVGFD
jgi:hypothetical protein